MISIRTVAPDDDLGAICAQMKPSNWAKDNEMTSYKPNLLKKFLESGNILVLAQDGNTVAGAAIAHKLPHPAGDHSLYVHELDTHPNYRRQGVASRIMSKMMEIAKEHKLTEVWLGTETDNIPANALYKKLKPYEIEESVIYAYKVK